MSISSLFRRSGSGCKKQLRRPPSRPIGRSHGFTPSLSFESLEDRRLLAAGLTPNDTRFHQQWGLESTEAPQAWELTTGSTKVTVAVNDSGVDYTHPDLYLNIWINQDEIPIAIGNQLQDVDADGLITFWDLNDPTGINIGAGKITDVNGTGFIDGGDLIQPVSSGGWADGQDDGDNGFIDDLIGWDFVANDNNPMDEDGHGTAVAGIIGSVANNSIGVAGINWKTRIMPVRREGIQPSINAFYYAVDNGAQVSNHSYGAPPTFFTEAERAATEAAIGYAEQHDHLAVVSSGNQKQNADLFPHLPAAFDHPNIVSVAATTKNDKLAEFSNFGIVTVDLGAPGKNTWSTWLSGTYSNFGGTSAAAPHVAGTAALILAQNQDLSFAEVKSLILDNVDPLPDLQGMTVTGGRLNVFKAVNATRVSVAVIARGAGNNVEYQPLARAIIETPVIDAMFRQEADRASISRLGNDAFTFHISSGRRDVGTRVSMVTDGLVPFQLGNAVVRNERAHRFGFAQSSKAGDYRTSTQEATDEFFGNLEES